MASKWRAAAANADRKPVLVSLRPIAGEMRIAALLAAASIVSGATSTSVGASVRIDTAQPGSGARVEIVARQQEAEFSVPEALQEIRRRASLTWDQLSMLFAVSRQSVHTWAKGGPIKPEHMAKVHGLLERVRGMKEARSFLVRRAVLQEAGLKDSTSSRRRVAQAEPVLSSDPRAFSKGLKTSRAGKTRVVRG